MENISVKNAVRAGSLERKEAGYGLKDIPGEQQGFNSLSNKLTAEGGKNIYIYLKSFNLINKQDFLILSPTSHYYYEENDFRNIRTIVNLIKLNTISNPDTFFATLIRVLPADVNFVGCFSGAKPFMGTRFLSDLTARVNNLLDLGPERIMDRKDVTGLLGKYGFRVIDMTEMNGLIYFYAQKTGQHLEIRA